MENFIYALIVFSKGGGCMLYASILRISFCTSVRWNKKSLHFMTSIGIVFKKKFYNNNITCYSVTVFLYPYHKRPPGEIYVCLHVKLLQSCPTLCNPMNCSPPGSSVHEIFQERIWEWDPWPLPGDLPNPGTEPMSLTSPALAGGFYIRSTIWEVPIYASNSIETMIIAKEMWVGNCKHLICQSETNHSFSLPVPTNFNIFITKSIHQK